MYYFVYGILYLLSLLPMPVLYLLSDGIYFLVFYVLAYRKKVVLGNLKTAFPEKSEHERNRIAKKFYHNFIDTFIETIKLISASNGFIKKRFYGASPVIDRLYEKGLKCQVHLGHNFNWEMANIGMPFYTKFIFIVVYMPINNKIFDRLFMKIRTLTGSILLPATNMKNELLPYRYKQYFLTLVADQVPGDVSNAYWLNFFGKPTPFLKGPERGARIGNIPVVFCQIKRLKRGHYQALFTLAEENPRKLPEGELTRRYIKFLEQVIREEPDMWLWSHRRWKKEWKDEYRELWIGEDEPSTVTAEINS